MGWQGNGGDGEGVGEGEREFERKVRTRGVERGRRAVVVVVVVDEVVVVVVDVDRSLKGEENEVPRGCKASLIIFCRSHDRGGATAGND